jgi:hypothetical protein
MTDSRVFLLFLTGVSLFISACGVLSAPGSGGSSNALSSTTNSTTDIQAFTQTVYPIAVQNCFNCHSSATAPLIAATDPNVAYQSVLNYINFSKVSSSDLLVQSANNHCGISNCVNNSQPFSNALYTWANFRAGVPIPSPSPSQTVSIPSAPAGLMYTVNPLAATVGSAISVDVLTSTGGSPSAVSISPPLPAGLTMNTSNGSISGTPTHAAASAAYTVTATNFLGSSSTVIQIQVQ